PPRSELFWGLFFCAARVLSVFPDPYETAEGYYILPEVDENASAYHVALPPELAGQNLLLTERNKMRWPFTVLETTEGLFLWFEPHSKGPFRVVYGFADRENDFVPATQSRDANLLERSLPLEFTGHRSAAEIEVFEGISRPLTYLALWLVTGVLVFIGLGVWYRRAIR
ncbi:MAG: hypothetical protein JJU29_04185, partial [Verrucomicrobia bacterium]|nr:hypothetical protein [Verrucomicrobiota bacterium]